MYAIICDARRGQSLGVDTLALVDRNLDNSVWWTSDRPEIVLCYRHKGTALAALSRFKHNNARVVDFANAKAIIESQRDSIRREELERMYNEAMAEDDPLGHGQDFIPY
jgi:hypothetical protein